MKHFLLMISLVFGFYCYSQKAFTSNKIHRPVLSDTIETLKQMSFCSCISNGFPQDTLSKKDPSIYLLLEGISGSFSLLDSIDSYTQHLIEKFPLTRKGQNRENTRVKRIMIGCIDMYKSKQLYLFLRKLYKEDKFLFPK
jgi:hypothetical protein